MNRINLLPALALALLLGSATLQAQHTFSIVAVDPETGEVGSAGASCVPFNAVIISSLFPGIGAINTQAQYDLGNQTYAGDLMRESQSAQAIIDSLTKHDISGNPGVRQYGVVTLAGTRRSAAYTGENCMDYKGHITGPTYSIQGNILLGRQILDSMEARFLRASGPLSGRLMAALQGANVIGADTRCAPYSSSHSAYIRVAKPADEEDNPWLDLSIALGSGSQKEPLDTLQKMYDAWKGGTTGVGAERGLAEPGARLSLHPNPATTSTVARIVCTERSTATLTLHDALGREARTMFTGSIEPGTYDFLLPVQDLPPGAYFCSLTVGIRVMSKKIVVK